MMRWLRARSGGTHRNHPDVRLSSLLYKNITIATMMTISSAMAAASLPT